MKFVRRITSLLFGVILSLSLLLATVAGAVAHLQMATGQVITICSDAGLAELTLDASGNPVATLHGCPDCLPGLHASVLPPSAALQCPLQKVVLTVHLPHLMVGVPQAAVTPIARGPPVLA